MPSKSRISHNRRPAQAVEQTTRAVRQSYDAAAGLVTEHPATSLLIVFGVGVGLGLLLGHALGEPPREQGGMSRIGRAMFDRMAQMMPESVSKRWSA